MTDKPIAWQYTSLISGTCILSHESPDRMVEIETFDIVPLYAHPQLLIDKQISSNEVIDKSKLKRLVTQVFGEDYQIIKRSEGMALVPMEPTLDMGWAYLDAARASSPDNDYYFSHDGYRAMIAAAQGEKK